MPLARVFGQTISCQNCFENSMSAQLVFQNCLSAQLVFQNCKSAQLGWLFRRSIVFRPTYGLFQFRIMFFEGKFFHHILQEIFACEYISRPTETHDIPGGLKPAESRGNQLPTILLVAVGIWLKTRGEMMKIGRENIAIFNGGRCLDRRSPRNFAY